MSSSSQSLSKLLNNASVYELILLLDHNIVHAIFRQTSAANFLLFAFLMSQMSVLLVIFQYIIVNALACTALTIVKVFPICDREAYIFTLRLLYSIDLSTARPKWRPDGPAMSGHLLYSLVNPTYANSYHHHPVR